MSWSKYVDLLLAEGAQEVVICGRQGGAVWAKSASANPTDAELKLIRAAMKHPKDVLAEAIAANVAPDALCPSLVRVCGRV